MIFDNRKYFKYKILNIKKKVTNKKVNELN